MGGLHQVCGTVLVHGRIFFFLFLVVFAYETEIKTEISSCFYLEKAPGQRNLLWHERSFGEGCT